MRKLVLLTTVCLVAFSCGNRNRNIPQNEAYENIEINETVPINVSDEHNSRNSLDYAGTYTGTLPCADCEGIRTVVTLTGDERYTITTEYLGKGDGTQYKQEGRYDWDFDGNSITFRDAEDMPSRFHVGENTLTVLDMDGNRITGDHEQHYILRK